MNSKESFLKKLSDQLLEWDNQIKELKVSSEKTKIEAKADLDKTIQDIISKRDELKVKIQELNKSGDEAWSIMKDGISRSSDELVNSFKSALSKFKKS